MAYDLAYFIDVVNEISDSLAYFRHSCYRFKLAYIILHVNPSNSCTKGNCKKISWYANNCTGKNVTPKCLCINWTLTHLLPSFHPQTASTFNSLNWCIFKYKISCNITNPQTNHLSSAARHYTNRLSMSRNQTFK